MEKQVYKLKLLKKWRIHDVFYISLLKKNITKKRWVDKDVTEFEVGSNNKDYKVEKI